MRINSIVLSRKIHSVLDNYMAFRFKHCEFNPQQRRLFFFYSDNYLYIIFIEIFTFVLECCFLFIYILQYNTMLLKSSKIIVLG